MTRIPLESSLSSRVDFESNPQGQITLTGFAQNVRTLSWGAFLILRLPNHLLQVVISKDSVPLPDIPVESTVRVTGKLKPAALKDKALNPSTVELEASRSRSSRVPREVPCRWTFRRRNSTRTRARSLICVPCRSVTPGSGPSSASSRASSTSSGTT